MTAAQRALLERAFAAEVEAALTGGPGILQARPSKTVTTMCAGGLLEERTVTMGGHPPMEVRGFALTERGRIAYCLSCDAEEP